jgi:hypothetical protein
MSLLPIPACVPISHAPCQKFLPAGVPTCLCSYQSRTLPKATFLHSFTRGDIRPAIKFCWLEPVLMSASATIFAAAEVCPSAFMLVVLCHAP